MRHHDVIMVFSTNIQRLFRSSLPKCSKQSELFSNTWFDWSHLNAPDVTRGVHEGCHRKNILFPEHVRDPTSSVFVCFLRLCCLSCFDSYLVILVLLFYCLSIESRSVQYTRPRVREITLLQHQVSHALLEFCSCHSCFVLLVMFAELKFVLPLLYWFLLLWRTTQANVIWHKLVWYVQTPGRV